jgi:hypothetical protein
MKYKILIVAFCVAAAFFFNYKFSMPPGFSPGWYFSLVFKEMATRGGNGVIEGKDGWHFLRESLCYLTRRWPDNEKTIVDFSTKLHERGIELIFVPVPDQIEIYPEKYFGRAIENVSPRRTLLIESLKSHNVKTVDLLPVFLQRQSTIEIFQPSETHWTQAGEQIAADAISQRIRELLPPADTVRHLYMTKDTCFSQVYDLIKLKFNDENKATHPNCVQKVLEPDSTLYKDQKVSPIMIMGDSFAGKGMGTSSHIGALIALRLGNPTWTMYNQLGSTDGPRLLRNLSAKTMTSKKVIVWLFASRSLIKKFSDVELPSQ